MIRGKGVRKLSLKDIAPQCEYYVNKEIYDLDLLCTGKKVLDVGCGFGRNKKSFSEKSAQWIGVEGFYGGICDVYGDAQLLPFKNNSFDIVIMDSVLEHIPDVAKAFAEVSRVLKKNGVFVGYAAFMECFHEISYSHLSFKALEYYSEVNGLKLEKIMGGSRFGIDYHLSILFFPFPFRLFRGLISSFIRCFIYIKSLCACAFLRVMKGRDKADAIKAMDLYYKIECFRQSNGYSYLIRKIR